MQYQHTLIFQQVLQEALRLKKGRGPQGNHSEPYKWEDLSEELRMATKCSTLKRFARIEDLRKDYRKKARLCLNHTLGYDLWEKLTPEIRDIFRGNTSLYAELHNNRAVSNVISWAYRCHDSQLNTLIGERGLQTTYFCYKPSFRFPGSLIKSLFSLIPEPREGNTEYLDVTEIQEARADAEDGLVKEASTGTGVSKSWKLWLFLKENRKEQPRVFCLDRLETLTKKSHFQDVNVITRMYGRVLESDMNWSNGLHAFKVCFVSVEADRTSHRSLHRGKKGALPYDENAQISAVPHSDKAKTWFPKENLKAAESVHLDPAAIDWIFSDLEGA